MDYFKIFSSDCAMGSGSQSVFYPEDPEKVYTCRAYYKLTFGGAHRYSLLYTNLVDSTFSDGSRSHRNQVIGGWKIWDCRIGLCGDAGIENAAEPEMFFPVTFEGKPHKNVAPGEFFSTDPLPLDAEAGSFLCVEMRYSGRELPCHPESWLPGFVKTDKGWESTPDLPFASMVGSDRPVGNRLIFLGDSITQGIGTPKNSYLHAAALIARKLGPDTAVWDIGLGFGRANDAATDGAWLYKAKQGDAVAVCFGVNDLFRIQAGALLKEDLTTIVRILKKSGLKVLIQTVPPFNYSDEVAEIWNEANRYIRNELANEADAMFDAAALLGKKEKPQEALYGGHPDITGNALWAEALYPVIQELLQK